MCQTNQTFSPWRESVSSLLLSEIVQANVHLLKVFDLRMRKGKTPPNWIENQKNKQGTANHFLPIQAEIEEEPSRFGPAFVVV